MKSPLILQILLTLFIGNVFAYPAQVIGISDGDTLTVLVDRKPIKVRIAEIDAPESRQPFGTRSKQALSDLCYREMADVVEVARDRYGRTVARVSCGGQDVATSQVRAGMAWVFDRYSRADSPLYGLQAEAKATRRGLWAEAAPVAPWEWRQR
jgi:endonuclease YncB( thermonuclease family)